MACDKLAAQFFQLIFFPPLPLNLDVNVQWNFSSPYLLTHVVGNLEGEIKMNVVLSEKF